MNSPAVSVVLPFKDSAPYLLRSLQSLADQSFTDFEVVMVDNGSSDASASIAADFASADSRFRYHTASGSLVNALNCGLETARGNWIARFDSDDICHRDRLWLQLKAATEHGEKTVVSCRVRSFPASEVSSGYRSYESWINSSTEPAEIERNLFVESPVPHPTAFYSRRAVLHAGGYRELGLPEDYELWLRLWSSGFSFYRVPRVLLAWRERKNRLSRVSPEYSLSAFYRLKAMYLKHVPCLRGKRVYVAGTGQCARRLSGCLLKEGFEIEAFLSPETSVHRKTLRGIPVASVEDWVPHQKGIPILGASREPGAREKIKEYLESIGLENMRDYVLCS